MSTPAHAYLDEHTVPVAAPQAVTWAALVAWADELCGAPHPVVGRLLGTQPRAGFAVDEAVEPERLSLVGRHRFSRYALVILVEDDGEGGSRLRAQSYADFPGPHGTVYRALVVGTGLHVVATRAMLRRIAALAVSPRPS